MVLTTAKIVSTLFALGNILLFWHLVQKQISQSFYRIVALFLYTINLQTVTSATFGMETSLYAFLVVLAYMLFKKRRESYRHALAFTFVSSLVILIRHEGPLFLLPFAVEALLERRNKVFHEGFLYIWLIVFLSYHVWHYTYFGELLTNPMIAKRQPPYLPNLGHPLLQIGNYLVPLIRLIALYPALFILLGLTHILRESLLPEKPKTDRLMTSIVITGLFLMAITGITWNDDADRLAYPSLAFLFLAIAHRLDALPMAAMRAGNRRLFDIVVGIALLINVAATIQSFRADFRFQVSVSSVTKIAKLSTLIQEQLEIEPLTLASPDMGGLLLFYGDGKRVIDLGFLCNRNLAHQGFDAIDQYVLAKEQPDIIEIHDNWTQPFVASERFYQAYVPLQVTVGDEIWFFFLRSDLIPKLQANSALSKITYEHGNTQDEVGMLVETYGYYWEISFPNPTH